MHNLYLTGDLNSKLVVLGQQLKRQHFTNSIEPAQVAIYGIGRSASCGKAYWEWCARKPQPNGLKCTHWVLLYRGVCREGRVSVTVPQWYENHDARERKTERTDQNRDRAHRSIKTQTERWETVYLNEAAIVTRKWRIVSISAVWSANKLDLFGLH